MTNINESITLGICPGTKEVGLAVIRDTELLYYGTRTFRGEWSPGKLKTILSAIHRIAKYYVVTAIAVKTPDPKRSSQALDTVMSGIKRQCKQSKIECYEFSLDEIKYRFIGTTKATRKELIVAADLFDELLYKGSSWDKKYYIKILEAVALARLVNGGIFLIPSLRSDG